MINLKSQFTLYWSPRTLDSPVWLAFEDDYIPLAQVVDFLRLKQPLI